MDENVKILEELFDKGYATRNVELIKGKFKAKIKSLVAKDQLDIEGNMTKDKARNNSAAYIIHSYSLKLLSKTLISYGDTVFETPDMAYSFLENLTNSIIDKLVKAQNGLEKDIRKALELDSIEQNFLETGPLPEKSEQPPEQISASPAV